MKRLVFAFLFCLFFSLVGCSNEEEKNAGEKTKQESKKNEHEKEQSEQVEQKTEQVEKVASSRIPFSQDEEEYYRIYLKNFENYDKYMQEIIRLLLEAEKNPLLYSDESWIGSLQGNYIGIALSNKLLDEMVTTGDIPTRFKEIHSLTQESMVIIGQSEEIILASTKNGGNKILYDEGMDVINKGINKLTEAGLKLQELLRTSGKLSNNE